MQKLNNLRSLYSIVLSQYSDYSYYVKNSIQKTGYLGEVMAIKYLERNGFQILHHHFTTHWGELDIIAKKQNKIHFIEVKTRTSEVKGKPYEAVTYYKIRSLSRAILVYINLHQLYKYKFSIDVISIYINPDSNISKLDHYCNIYSQGFYI